MVASASWTARNAFRRKNATRSGARVGSLIRTGNAKQKRRTAFNEEESAAAKNLPRQSRTCAGYAQRRASEAAAETSLAQFPLQGDRSSRRDGEQ